MDLVYETERMPGPDESLDALSLVYKCGDEGSNTAVAIYRAQHDEPKSLLDHVNAVTSTASSADGDVSNDQKRDEVKVYLNTAVGDDTFGKQLMNNLVQNGIDVSGVHTLEDDQTGTCAVFVETLTGRSRDIGFPGANTNWLPLDQDSVECLAGGNKADLIVTHLENDPKVVESVLETASKNGVETLLNPSPVYHMPSAIYKKVTHLVMNEIEAAKLAGLSREVVTEESLLEVCTHFRELGVKHVVITQVHRGAFYATEGAYGLVEAVKNVEVKDTTGAGYVSVATYLLAIPVSSKIMFAANVIICLVTLSLLIRR